MKLLFDENLSHRLVSALSDVYPKSAHVRDLGLKAAVDTDLWNYAKGNEFVIVSKDSDFHQRSLLLGSPPKVIWVRLGNCSTNEVARVLRHHMMDVQKFNEDGTATFLIIS